MRWETTAVTVSAYLRTGRVTGLLMLWTQLLWTEVAVAHEFKVLQLQVPSRCCNCTALQCNNDTATISLFIVTVITKVCVLSNNCIYKLHCDVNKTTGDIYLSLSDEPISSVGLVTKEPHIRQKWEIKSEKNNSILPVYIQFISTCERVQNIL